VFPIPFAVPDDILGINASFSSVYNVIINGLVKSSGPCYCHSKTSIHINKTRYSVEHHILGLNFKGYRRGSTKTEKGQFKEP